MSMAGCLAVAFTDVIASAQPADPAGYLDYFELTDGRVIDVGALGGGLEGDPNTHKIFVDAQPQGKGLPVDGRLTGVIHGKTRVVGFGDRNGDGYINGMDLDATFDVAWQLVGHKKATEEVFFVTDVAVGPEGTPRPWGDPSVNFPPLAGGEASVWNIAACSTKGGFDVGGGLESCDPLAIPDPGPDAPYTGFVDYTFSVSIPGFNDFTPGLEVDADTNWILASLIGLTDLAPEGAVEFGLAPVYDPLIAVAEANADLDGPNLLLGGKANIPIANLLTTVEIVVVPEPATLWLVGLAAVGVFRRRRSR
jgi:hypothetical protein